MERRRTPVRLAGLLVAALLVTTGLGACERNTVVGSGPVATVNGHPVSRAKLEQLLEANRAYLRVLSKDKTNGPAAAKELAAYGGASTSTVSKSKVSDLLTQLIVYQATIDDLEAHGARPSAAEEDKARKELVSSVGEDQLKKAGSDLVTFNVKSAAATSALEALVSKSTAPTDAEIRAAYPQYAATKPLCLALIFTIDQETANTAKQRVQSGEDFGKVAEALSADSQTSLQGGFAGCADATQAQSSFGVDLSKAAVGDLVGPFAVAQQGYALLKVVSTTGPTFAQAKAQISSAIAGSTASQDALAKRQKDLLRKAKVTVDSRYGRWSASEGRVVTS